jgi:hypothetical protein
MLPTESSVAEAMSFVAVPAVALPKTMLHPSLREGVKPVDQLPAPPFHVETGLFV